MKLIERIKAFFAPECPRVLMGYKCKANRPGGCDECGRGTAK